MSAEAVAAPASTPNETAGDRALRQAAENLATAPNTKFADLTAALERSVSAGQAEAALILLGGAERFLTEDDAAFRQKFVLTLTALIGACQREKLSDPARKAIEIVLRLLADPAAEQAKLSAAAVADFARRAGRFALGRREDELFAELAGTVAGWMVRSCDGRAAEPMLPVFEVWFYRMVRHDRDRAAANVFAALGTLIAAEKDKMGFLAQFLQEWRFAVSTAALKPGSSLAAGLMEQLLLFALQSGQRSFWPPVIQTAGDAAAFTATRHGVTAGFFLIRPLLDVGRVTLGDELKFGPGEGESGLRQMIIRLVCSQALRIANLAARGDMLAVAGDKIEEMFRSWLRLPEYEAHHRSICRFCQMLLIVWAHHFRRAAKKWAPRESELSEPLLLSEADQAKLTFLL